mmetsp:Transcript_24378/g.54973  ORF Transcript_24378/g.54973 Transcript_24378/m.54973 type:complete len:449 (-) Transcript_24378:374-1720(-)|eukprot:CAMPEP_0172594178 /NCGR_PEP_ID=MMETSP1068-20121228/13513_1 /TAXON_ID=35684 /ORGANISM="Pseudopedinella elastica, Strain CCMP716" /LENGTH=448 /DNA_ID=CAMNT_0013392063 /DNA_START=37 /DNA_END=1383 /DNA_ORIENTATION=-
MNFPSPMLSAATLATLVFGAICIYVLLIYSLRERRQEHIASLASAALLAKAHSETWKAHSSLSYCPHSGAQDRLLFSGSTWRVHNLITSLELPFECSLAMSARGLFLTYAVPSISSVLKKTGGFERDVQRRYADMELLIREFNDNAADGTLNWNGRPDRAKKACQRLNAIHQQYSKRILYNDMVYVWSTFVCTPALWMDTRWSWRRLTNDEKACHFWYWVDIGRHLNLHVNIHFRNLDEVVDFKRRYEAKHVHFCESNRAVAHATIEYFLQGQIPYFLKPLVRPLVFQLMSALQEEPSHRAALGLPNPPWTLIALGLDAALTARSLVTRVLLPPRSFGRIERVTATDGVAVNLGHQPTSSCPLKVYYSPLKRLDFNNPTYYPAARTMPGSVDIGGGSSKQGAQPLTSAPAGAYAIEDMGPKHVPKGLLVEKPIYVGHPEDPRKWAPFL